MTIHIAECDFIKLKDLHHSDFSDLYLNFIQRSLRFSKIYMVDEDGYFIVSSDESFYPGAIIALKPSKPGNLQHYLELSFKLVEYSSGYFVYDTNNLFAFDFVWRLKLPTRALSAIITWNNNAVSEANQDYLALLKTNENDIDEALELLAQVKECDGGLPKNVISFGTSQHGIYTIQNSLKKVIGAFCLEFLPNNFVGINPLVIIENEKHKGYEKWALGYIGDQLFQSQKTLVIGLMNDNSELFIDMLELGMRVEKQIYLSAVGSVI